MPLLHSRRFSHQSAAAPATPHIDSRRASVSSSVIDDVQSVSNESSEVSTAKAEKFVRAVMQRAIDGIQIAGYEPISSAASLTAQYLNDAKYVTVEERIKALVKKEGMKALSLGFGTNLGGFAFQIVGLPAQLILGFALQARVIACIAMLYGHDITSQPVQTMVLLSLLGSEKLVQHVLQRATAQAAENLVSRVVLRSSSRTLNTIQHLVGAALMTRMLPKNQLTRSLAKVSIGTVPIVGNFVGGAVGGAFEWASMRAHAKLAKHIFSQQASMGTLPSGDQVIIEEEEAEAVVIEELVEAASPTSAAERRQSIPVQCC